MFVMHQIVGAEGRVASLKVPKLGDGLPTDSTPPYLAPIGFRVPGCEAVGLEPDKKLNPEFLKPWPWSLETQTPNPPPTADRHWGIGVIRGVGKLHLHKLLRQLQSLICTSAGSLSLGFQVPSSGCI